MTEHNYREVSCQKATSGEEFVRGVQDFNFSLGAPNVWIPRKSYFKIGIEIKGKNGAILSTADCTALADDVCGGLYNNAFFRIGGQDVSTINNYVPQASILKNRFGRSNAWLKSIGNSNGFIESDLNKRVARLANDSPSDLASRPTILPLAQGVAAADVITVALAQTGVITGVGTTFTTILAGNIGAAGVVKNVYLYINGLQFLVRTITDATTIGVENPRQVEIGATANAYFVINKPYDADGKNKIDVLWQPPLGIFDLMDENKVENEVLGAGDYRISLNPNSNYKFACLETTKQGVASADPDRIAAAALAPGNPGFFDINITDVKFYMAYCKMAIEENKVRQLSLAEMMILSKPLAGTSNTYEFSVPSSTQCLAVFFQSPAQGSNSNYPPSKFVMLKNKQNYLSGLQITYGNTTKPSTKWQSKYDTSTNQLVQRYHDNLSEAGLIFNVGGAESIQDYMNRGLYILYNFIRDQNDRSTQVQVSVDFSLLDAGNTELEANASVYLCAIYDRQTEITTANGTVVSVRSQN